jgi:hypothetical protein
MKISQKVLKSGRLKFECLKYLNVLFEWHVVVPCTKPFFVDIKL